MDAESLSIDWSDGAGALSQARALYDQWGCFIARRFFPRDELAPIRREIQKLIDLAQGRTAPRSPADRFDDGYAALHESDPQAADAIFGALRRLTSVHQLSVAPRLLQLSQALMATELVMSSPYKPTRIDFQGRQGNLLPWHQDYPYAQDSPDGIVYWIPLQDVDSRNGCLVAAPGSHKLGIVPVAMIPPPQNAAGGIKGLRVADPSVVDAFPHVALPMQEGDALIFSNLLFHRSQINHTATLRWTVQIRHGNFAHPMSVGKGWPRGHYERHWFDETHPEYVVAE